MNKLLVLLLLAHLPIHSMDNDKGIPLESAPRYQPRSLTSLCISKLETHIRETMFPQQCALLAQVIDTQFPMPEDPYGTISKEQALGLLIALTNISQENELLRITPVSIEIKNILTEYYPGLIQELTQQILSILYQKRKSMVEVCTGLVVEGFARETKWEEQVLFKSAHPILFRFLNEKIKHQIKCRSEFHPHRKRGKDGTYSDDWCP